MAFLDTPRPNPPPSSRGRSRTGLAGLLFGWGTVLPAAA
ncbi:hypothetical protein D187_003146 [Cystobacter fuscus DSM 2262]|uniref:Uncharacterized protein n=1 Tax=Cystobacter fuscus (strain ATCC 25194 / DSM 2262 / NBRC 100088 / M29) TaxID=1242864 RepID=S9PAF4_CYSF2|nr:hypothetical protein D187_003146 [Cystobacter fuscus DSM 2262]